MGTKIKYFNNSFRLQTYLEQIYYQKMSRRHIAVTFSAAFPSLRGRPERFHQRIAVTS